MSKQMYINNGLQAINELYVPLSNLNKAMEDLQKCDDISANDKDNLNYWYMQLTGTGMLDDIKDVLNYLELLKD